jgi:RecA-family ATPase
MGDDAGAGLARVLEYVRIMDLSAIPFRLALVADDVVLPSVANIEALIEHLESENFRPDWIICDPAVSLGVGEARVNDGEQGLIEAARILRNRLNCCVEFIHHVGKGNARDRNSDQYGYRGGSAFADGARMVAVLNPVPPEEWLKETGTPLLEGETGIKVDMPKMSYAKARPPVFIVRDGWHFSQRAAVNADPERDREAIANQVAQFIRHHADQGTTLSGRELEDLREDMNLSRDAVRAAVARLRVSGRIHEAGEPGKRRWLELTNPRGDAAATGGEK